MLHVARAVCLRKDKSPQHTLSSDNPEKKSWTEHKHMAQIVASSYARSDNLKVQKWADNMQFCASHIAMGYEKIHGGAFDGKYKRSVASADLCRIRTCPICQWRRSRKLTATVGRALENVMDGRADKSAWMLTLTLKNCDIAELKETCKDMFKAWSKMTKQTFFKSAVTHWTRSLEITTGERKHIKNDSHPHIHAALVCDTDMLHDKWHNNLWWAGKWKELLGLDYFPQVHITPIIAKKAGQSLEGAIREVFKYSVKPDAGIAISGWLEKVALQIGGLRLVGISKSLNECVSENLDEEAHEYSVCDELPAGISPLAGDNIVIIYRWMNYRTHYERQQVHWMSVDDYKEGVYIQNCLSNGVRPIIKKKVQK